MGRMATVSTEPLVPHPPPKKQEGFKSDTKKDILTRPDAKQGLVFSKRSVGTCMEVVVSDFLNHLREFSFICSFFQPYLPYYTPGLRPEKKTETNTTKSFVSRSLGARQGMSPADRNTLKLLADQGTRSQREEMTPGTRGSTGGFL